MMLSYLCMAIMMALLLKCHLCDVNLEGIHMIFRIVLTGQIMTSLSQIIKGCAPLKMTDLGVQGRP